MRGDSAVIEALNDVLTAELTAVNQYFIHHKMCENWGYQRLAKKKYEESIGEMKDADAVIERILYLEGVPNMQRLNPVRVGEDPIEQHRLDLALETEAIVRLNAGIALCREKGDNGSRELLVRIRAVLRRAAYAGQQYWGRPVPGFGPADARIAYKIMWNWDYKWHSTDDVDLRNFDADTGSIADRLRSTDPSRFIFGGVPTSTMDAARARWRSMPAFD